MAIPHTSHLLVFLLFFLKQERQVPPRDTKDNPLYTIGQ